jgi:DNA-binding CsgD family transcriptional regulator
MTADRAFDETIHLLYEAATDASLWPHALASLSNLMGSVVSHYLFLDKVKAEAAFSVVDAGYPAEANDDYLRYYGKIDPKPALAIQRPSGQIIACHHHFDDAFIAKSEFYQDYLIPLGVRYFAGVKLIDSGDVSALYGLLRAPGQGRFEDVDLKLFARLRPHLLQATKIFQRLRELSSDHAQAWAALDRVPWGVIVVDQTGRVLAANAAAEAVLKKQDGLRVRQGRLETENPAQTSDLRRLVHGAATLRLDGGGQPGGALAIERRSGGRRLVILVAPLRGGRMLADTARPRAVLFVAEGDGQLVAPETTIMGLFGLTAAEAQIALALSSGKTMDEIASERGVSKNTVRAQMQVILSKTGTSRQAEVVRLILSLPSMR